MSTNEEPLPDLDVVQAVLTEQEPDVTAGVGWLVASTSKAKSKPKKKKSVMDVAQPEPVRIDDQFNGENVEKIKGFVDRNEKILVILRGCPGSGKSTLASQIKYNGVIVSADNYFINDRGVYVFNALKLTDAHIACRNQVNEALRNKVSPVIVDNTNLKGWEFKAYAIQAYKNGYHVELMEPSTPWKYKASTLATKNIHNVPLNKIQKCLVDFEKNIDLKRLTGVSQTLPRAKPGTFIKNYEQYFTGMDWSASTPVFVEDTKGKVTEGARKISPESLFARVKHNSVPNVADSVWDGQLEASETDDLRNDVTVDKGPDLRGGSVEKSSPVDGYKESVELLKGMFSDVDEEILLDFLHKYDNDVTMVTNILLDSLNLDDCKDNRGTKRTEAEPEPDLKEPEIVSLHDLCMDQINQRQGDISWNDLQIPEEPEYFDCKSTLSQVSPASSCVSEKIRHTPNRQVDTSFKELYANSRSKKPGAFQPTFKTPYVRSESVNENKNVPVVDEDPGGCGMPRSSSYSFGERKPGAVIEAELDEPILKLNLNQEFLSSLIQLFGEDSDEAYLQKNQNIEIGIKMAYELFIAWKSTNKSLDNQTKPYDSGDTFATETSQIERDEKLSRELFDQINMRDPIEKQPAFFSDRGINAAQSSLRQIMAEEMAEQLKQVKSKKTATSFQINPKSLPVVDFTKVLPADNTQSKFNIKSSRASNNSGTIPFLANTEATDVDENTNNEYRSLANKYCDIRAAYFKKAGEAFKKGGLWAGVAQYYAERGHEQTASMQASNDMAASHTFLNNNPDFQKSNTLDLHGLQVKEAITVLKQVIAERKKDLHSKEGKRKKTYIFVITGFGHNSENGPRLRPNVINYLNQSGIRYQEPNIGLLKIDLLSS